MAFEEMIKKALDESRNNCRLGDTLEEVREIQNYIKNAEKIYIPNKNGIKVDVLNKVLREYNLPSAKILQINTNEADSNRSPAFAKAIIQNRKLTEEEIPLIISEKEQIIKKSGLLEYFHPKEYLTNIGGLDNLKDWIAKRGNAYSDEAKAYGLNTPRGVLLLGVRRDPTGREFPREKATESLRRELLAGLMRDVKLDSLKPNPQNSRAKEFFACLRRELSNFPRLFRGQFSSPHSPWFR